MIATVLVYVTWSSILMLLLEFPSPAASGANTTDIENGDSIAERYMCGNERYG